MCFFAGHPLGVAICSCSCCYTLYTLWGNTGELIHAQFLTLKCAFIAVYVVPHMMPLDPRPALLLVL